MRMGRRRSQIQRTVASRTRTNVAKLMHDHCVALGVDPPEQVTAQLAVGRMALLLGDVYARVEGIVGAFDRDSFVKAMLQVCDDPSELESILRADGLIELFDSAIVVAGLASEDQE